MAKKEKYTDVGKKIGGAKKDLWKKNGVSLEDLKDMELGDTSIYVSKEYIWKKPNYEKLVHEEGLPKEVVYFRKIVRDALLPKPVFHEQVNSVEDAREQLENYIDYITTIKDGMEKCKTIDDCFSYFSVFKAKFVDQVVGLRAIINPKYTDFIDNKIFKALQTKQYALTKQVEKKKFCWTEKEKLLAGYKVIEITPWCTWENDSYNGLRICDEDATSRSYYFDREMKSLEMAEACYPEYSWFVTGKHSHYIWEKGFVSKEEAEKFILDHEKEQKETKREQKKRNKEITPPQLKNVKREGGRDCRDGQHILPQNVDENFCGTFHFAALEFGNWLNENDRATNLDMCFEAFSDISDILKIDPQSVSLGGELSLAFGSRGKGGKNAALAHYEPSYNVINLTKMKGAGSLGHEWFHALDRFIAKQCGYLDLFDHNWSMVERDSQKLKANFPELYDVMDTIVFAEKPKDDSLLAQYKRPRTQFYKDALDLDGNRRNSYWASRCELFARAGAAYLKVVSDKIGLRNDYLSGHACSWSVKKENGKEVFPYPRGEEMKRIQRAFDRFFDACIERNYLKIMIEPAMSVEAQQKKAILDPLQSMMSKESYKLIEDNFGQLGFDFEME